MARERRYSADQSIRATNLRGPARERKPGERTVLEGESAATIDAYRRTVPRDQAVGNALIGAQP